MKILVGKNHGFSIAYGLSQKLRVANRGSNIKTTCWLVPRNEEALSAITKSESHLCDYSCTRGVACDLVFRQRKMMYIFGNVNEENAYRNPI